LAGDNGKPAPAPAGVSEELAAAIRKVNAAFDRLPSSVQGEVEIAFPELEAEVNLAIIAGEREKALAAIAKWRDHLLALFADKVCPRPDPRTVVGPKADGEACGRRTTEEVGG
jgi:hypothetical protein